MDRPLDTGGGEGRGGKREIILIEEGKRQKESLKLFLTL